MRTLIATTLVLLPIGLAQPVAAGDDKNSPTDLPIRIDVPVQLEQANVVFNMNHFVMRGDMPVGLRYMDALSKRLAEAGTKGQIIGVFYSQAAHFTLTDKAYNAYRNVASGNPYKEVIANLIKQGVQLEECAVSMENNHWTNDDLLPGVKVNTDAVRRLIQLEQQGFVQIQP